MIKIQKITHANPQQKSQNQLINYLVNKLKNIKSIGKMIKKKQHQHTIQFEEVEICAEIDAKWVAIDQLARAECQKNTFRLKLNRRPKMKTQSFIIFFTKILDMQFYLNEFLFN